MSLFGNELIKLRVWAELFFDQMDQDLSCEEVYSGHLKANIISDKVLLLLLICFWALSFLT